MAPTGQSSIPPPFSVCSHQGGLWLLRVSALKSCSRFRKSGSPGTSAGTGERRRCFAERWERDRAVLPEQPSPVLEPNGQRLPPFLPFLPSFLHARECARCPFRPAAPHCCLRTHPPFFLPLPASLMTSTKGEMMESIFMGMISIKCQLTWGLSHACTASRVNVHLISQRSTRPRGNDPQGPGPTSRRPPSPPPGRPPDAPGPAHRAAAPCGFSPAAATGRPRATRPRLSRGSARPRPRGGGSAAPGGGSGGAAAGVDPGRVGPGFFLPEERHM